MPTKAIHFISGLPRSGSTLLCNILAQNPEFHTTPTSACHDIMFVVRNFWNSKECIEHQASKELADDKNLKRVLSAVLQSYHDTDSPVVLDKGRGWLSLIEMAEFALGRKAKVIVPVRNLSAICASFEKLHRKAAHKNQDKGDYFKSQTVIGRTDQLLSDSGVVGLAYNRLLDALQRGLGDRMHFVEFEELTKNPIDTLDGIYRFLELPKFKHNFLNIEQVTHEDDSVHRLDLHTIRRSVAPVPDDSLEVLGEGLVKRLSGAEIWRK